MIHENGEYKDHKHIILILLRSLYEYNLWNSIQMIIMIPFQSIPYSILCAIYKIINQITLLLVSITLDDYVYNIHWYYQFIIIYLEFYYYLNILLNYIIYQSMILLSIWMIIRNMNNEYILSILISNIISNTSYQMKYDINIDSIIIKQYYLQQEN